MSATYAIRDAIIADLNAASFSLPFTAVPVLLQVRDLVDLGTLKVSVMAAERLPSPATRGGRRRYDYRIDVAVQYKFAPAQAMDTEPYMALAEELVEFYSFNRANPAALPQAVWDKGEHLFLTVDEHIERRLFTSVVAYYFHVT